MGNILTENSGLDKHMQYRSHYKPNDLLWGIGLENETYLEFDKRISAGYDFFMTNHKSERYSVNYFKNYKPDLFRKHTVKWLQDYEKNYLQPAYSLPVLMNSHSFSKVDINKQHATLQGTANLPNPDFNGKTLLAYLNEIDPYFEEEYGKKFIFDGDTIEFFTSNFYKGTIEDCIGQLLRRKRIFIHKIKRHFKAHNLFSAHGQIDFCKKNHGFATMISTDCENLAIFNNMTYHVNLTLPTVLDNDAKVADKELFVAQHRNAARILQWIEPLIIAQYGSGDVLSSVSKGVANGSQRCALSRYIGVGTYNTNKMPTGKLLTQPFKTHDYYNIPYWWYHEFYKNSDYIPCEEIGFDINFNKHLNHGIEIRMLDYFSEKRLHKLLSFFVYLMDFSLTTDIANPVYSKAWNLATCDIVRHGSKARITREMQNEYSNLFQLNARTSSPAKMFDVLFTNLKEQFHGKGPMSKCMIKPPVKNKTPVYAALEAY